MTLAIIPLAIGTSLRRIVACCTVASMLVAIGPRPVAAQAIWETRVFIHERCPTEPPAPPVQPGALAPVLLSVLSFLIPKAVDFGLSFVNKHLQEKKNEEEEKNKPKTTSALVAADAFYQLQGGRQPSMGLLMKDRCLVVVRGNFGKPNNPSNDCSQFKQTALRQSATCEWLHARGIYPSAAGSEGPVGIYLEAKFVFSEEGTSFRLQPHYFSYHLPLVPGDNSDVDRYDTTFTFNFEPSAPGQTVAPFAVGILVFQQLKRSIVLDKDDLVGKSTGWMLVPPLSEPMNAEVKRVKDLYDSQVALTAQVKGITDALPALQSKAEKLMAALSPAPPPAPAPAPASNVFADGQAIAVKFAAGEKFDDVLIGAQLDTNAGTASSITPDALQGAQRKVSRQLEIRTNTSYRATVSELKTVAEEGLKRLAEKKAAEADLAAKTQEIARWTAGKRLVLPFTVRASMTEQPFLPKNFFILTAAEAFSATTQKELGSLISSTLTQTLGLESKDAQIQKVEDQGKLLVGALKALNAARDAQYELDHLAADAAEPEKRKKALTLDTAKIDANLAYLKASLAPPFPDAFGGH